MRMVKAYLKKNPQEKGRILRVYESDTKQKRLEVSFAYGTIDADAGEFEILIEDRNQVLNG